MPCTEWEEYDKGQFGGMSSGDKMEERERRGKGGMRDRQYQDGEGGMEDAGNGGRVSEW